MKIAGTSNSANFKAAYKHGRGTDSGNYVQGAKTTFESAQGQKVLKQLPDNMLINTNKTAGGNLLFVDAYVGENKFYFAKEVEQKFSLGAFVRDMKKAAKENGINIKTNKQSVLGGLKVPRMVKRAVAAAASVFA